MNTVSSTTTVPVRRLIDTHCHVYDEAFSEDLPQVIARAREAGIVRLLLPNINENTVGDMLGLCDTWPDLCMPMIGLHPEDLASDYKRQLEFLKALLDEDRQGPCRYIGIGETGLDLYWDSTRTDEQVSSFRTQVGWALEYDLPLAVHARACDDLLYEVMSSYSNTPLRGVFHCFSGDRAQAARLMRFEGFMFGIGGTLTYKKSSLPETLAAEVPLDRIVLETDCPYLPPVPHRGRRNEPSYVALVADRLADIYGCSAVEIGERTTANATLLFRL